MDVDGPLGFAFFLVLIWRAPLNAWQHCSRLSESVDATVLRVSAHLLGIMADSFLDDKFW